MNEEIQAMSPKTRLKIEVSPKLAQELPLDPAARSKILEIGLRQWRIWEALESYRQGKGTLAHAAQKARIPLREMIPHAYAYGLTPKVDPNWLREDLSVEEAAAL